MLNNTDCVQVIENFFPPIVLEALQDYVYSSDADWVWQDYTTTITGRRDFGVEVDDSGHYSCVVMLEDRCKQRQVPTFIPNVKSTIESAIGGSVNIVRLKINRQTPRQIDPQKVNIPHRDTSRPGHWAVVVFLTDSLGDTAIYNETSAEFESGSCTGLTEYVRVSPKTNRAIILPADLMHAGSSARGDEDRIVVNIIYEVV